MSASLVTPTQDEPLTLSEFKNFLRVDTNDDDTLISALARAARTHIESTLSLMLVAQSWRITRDVWPKGGQMDLPFGPVSALSSVRVMGQGGWQKLPLAKFRLDGGRNPPRLSWDIGSPPDPLPAYGGIEIEVACGFGPPAAVPEPLKQALRLLVSHWYDQRGVTVIGHDIARVPYAVEALLAPYKARRLA